MLMQSENRNRIRQNSNNEKFAISLLAGIYRRRFQRSDTALRKHPLLRVPTDGELQKAAQRIYKAIYDVIATSLADMPSKMTKGVKLTVQLSKESDAAKKELQNELKDWLSSNQTKGIDNARIQEALAPNIVNWDYVNMDAQEFLDSYTIKLSDHLSAQAEYELRTAIADGLTKGEGAKELEARIRDQVVNTYEGRAEAIARTEGMRALNQGRLKAYDAMGFDKIFWIASDLACEECKPLDGKIFNLGEEPPIPLHPNCRCTTGAVTSMTPTVGDQVTQPEDLPEGFQWA